MRQVAGSGSGEWFASGDWGTSSFRLRAVPLREGAALAAVTGDRGVRAFTPGDAPGFRACLESALASLQAGAGACEGAPRAVVLSGMVSSTIGWRELPYARTPWDATDGGSLGWSMLEPVGDAPLFLLSGVRSARDIMRGEECEIAGLVADRGAGLASGRVLMLLPGTHSKHVALADGVIEDFHTFMSGELTETLARHSVLAASVDWPGFAAADGRPGDSAGEAGFRRGLEAARQEGLAAGLFSVRAEAVLAGTSPLAAMRHLHGLVIGTEVLAACRRAREERRRLVLAAGTRFRPAYVAALERLVTEGQTFEAMAEERVEVAVCAGHRAFLASRGVRPASV